MAATVRATRPQGATFIELFFDLVFVFAVTQVTHVLTQHLDTTGVLRTALIFWLVWWAWTQFTWTLNAADTEHPGIELLTMAGVVAAFLMALAVPGAFGEAGGWFAGAYTAVRLIGIGGQFWVSAGDTEARSALRTWAAFSLVGLCAVVVGALLAPGPRTIAFGVAVAIDLVSAWRAGDGEWRLYPGHFAERHGLFVIIALGESLIIAGGGSTDTELQVSTVLPPVLVTAALWWTYFGWAKDAMEEAGAATPSARRGAFSRDVYSLLHYLVVAGVISFAVAIEETVAHPGEHLGPVGVAALVIGVALFVGGTGVALLRAGAGLPTVRVAAVGVLIVASPLLATVPATTAMALVAAAVTAVAAIEHRGRRGRAHVAASD